MAEHGDAVTRALTDAGVLTASSCETDAGWFVKVRRGRRSFDMLVTESDGHVFFLCAVTSRPPSSPFTPDDLRQLLKMNTEVPLAKVDFGRVPEDVLPDRDEVLSALAVIPIEGLTPGRVRQASGACAELAERLGRRFA